MEKEQSRRLLEALRSLKKNRPVLHTQGLSQNEFFLLFNMKQHFEKSGEDSMRIGDLQNCVHTSLPAVSQSLGTLEAKKLIVRRVDPSDRRSVKVMLTDEGRDAVEKAQEEAKRVLERIEQQLGGENMEQLITLLERLSGALDVIWEENAGARRSEWSAKKERQL